MANLNNTIVLKGELGERHEEANASEILYPGHLIEIISDGRCRKNTSLGGKGGMYFAKEDSLQGKTVNQAYAVGDPVLYHIAQKGDVIYARLPAGAVALLKGDDIISNGDGTFIKSLATDVLYSDVAASAAITNTTVETAFDKTYTIPAGALRAGDVLRVKAQGIATATNSTDTLNVKLYVGTQAICATGAVDVANNDIFRIDASITIRTAGASGTYIAEGTTALGASGTVTDKAFFLPSTAIDTTVANVITVKATWSVANAGNSVRLDELTVEKVDAITGAAGVNAKVEEASDNSAGVAESWVKIRIL